MAKSTQITSDNIPNLADDREYAQAVSLLKAFEDAQRGVERRVTIIELEDYAIANRQNVKDVRDTAIRARLDRLQKEDASTPAPVSPTAIETPSIPRR